MKNDSCTVAEYINKGKSDSCPIIDMHAHMGPYVGLYMPGAPLDIMRATLKRYGVKKIVCVPHIGMTGKPEKGNDLMQEVINMYPEQFLGYCIINPNFPETVKSTINNYKELKG